MTKQIRYTIALSLLTLTLIGAACPQVADRLKKLSNVVALFEPFVQTLGIVPEVLKPIIADGKDITQVASDLAADMNVAATRAQKFAAVDTAQKKLAVIINRGNLSKDARVMSIVSLISKAFSSVADFYSDAPKSDPNSTKSEKELAKQLDTRIEEIRQAMRK